MNNINRILCVRYYVWLWSLKEPERKHFVRVVSSPGFEEMLNATIEALGKFPSGGEWDTFAMHRRTVFLRVCQALCEEKVADGQRLIAAIAMATMDLAEPLLACKVFEEVPANNHLN